MSTAARMWREEHGAIVSAELLVIASLLVIGVIVGLKSLRDSVVSEIADVAQAFANVDQSFWYSATGGHHGFTGGGQFNDLGDFCDQAEWGPHQDSKCVVICDSSLHPTGPSADGAQKTLR